jgi:hypothetical protein
MHKVKIKFKRHLHNANTNIFAYIHKAKIKFIRHLHNANINKFSYTKIKPTPCNDSVLLPKFLPMLYNMCNFFIAMRCSLSECMKLFKCIDDCFSFQSWDLFCNLLTSGHSARIIQTHLHHLGFALKSSPLLYFFNDTQCYVKQN